MLIDLKGVTKFYGPIKAIDDLTVSVPPGAIGLLGPNGAGKSTLIKALLGLVRLSAGDAMVLTHDVRTQSREIRQNVGYMPEDECTLAGLKGVEAVSFAGELAGLPPRVSLRRSHEILDYVGIAEERYREVQTYSTGMRQKMKLAQAIIHAPKMIFLDEPTGGLDPQARARMLQLIRGLSQKKGVSVVLSTHILQDVESCCDSVLILGKGRLLVFDELENLKRPLDNSYLVRLSGDMDRFRQALDAQRCRTEVRQGDEVHVHGERGDLALLIFQIAKDIGAAVRQISASRNSLEEIFLKAVTGNHDAHL